MHSLTSRIVIGTALFALVACAGSSGGGSNGGQTGGNAGSGGQTGGNAGTGGQGGSAGNAGAGGKAGSAGSGGAAGSAGSGGKGGNAGSGGAAGNAGAGGKGGSAGSGGAAGSAGTGGAAGNAGAGGKGGDAGAGGAAGAAGAGGKGGSAGGAGGNAGAGGSGVGGASGGQGFACTTINGQSVTQVFNDWYDKWHADHFRTCGGSLARIIGCNGDDNTCSEGIGYGMLLTVAHGDQADFDGLNAFRKKLGALYDAKFTSGGLMAWNSGSTCPPSGGDANNAPDGDLDAAMALIQASKKFSPGDSYKADALALIDGIWAKNVGTSGGKPFLGAGTSNINDKSYMSYWTLGYFQVFARFVGDATKAQNWKNLAARGYELLSSIQSQPACNGEFPESVQINGTLWGGDNCDFGYDSCRVPWRLAADYMWFGTAETGAMLKKIRDNVVKGDPVANARAKNSAFVGGLALSGVSADQATIDDFCKRWITAKAAGGEYDDKPYFQKSLALVYLLVAGGLFDRVVAP